MRSPAIGYRFLTIKGFYAQMIASNPSALAMHFAEFRQTIASPALQAIAAHWDSIRGEGQLPSWEMLRPSEIAPHLSMVWAYKYDRQTGAFTGRLASTRIALALGKNFRGIALEEVHPPEALPRVRRYMTRIVSEPAAFRSAGSLFRQRDAVVEGERIVLPLASDGVHCDGMLGASDYYWPHPNPDNGPIELLSDIEGWCPMALMADRKS
jgi:hypothetical protein